MPSSPSVSGGGIVELFFFPNLKNDEAFRDITDRLDEPSPLDDTRDTLLRFGVKNGRPLLGVEDEEPVFIVDSDTVGDCNVVLDLLNIDAPYTFPSFGGNGGGFNEEEEDEDEEDILKTFRVEKRDFELVLAICDGPSTGGFSV
jgi:hypothetical protein